MIKTDRQLDVTNARLNEFRSLLARLDEARTEVGLHDLRAQVHSAAVASQAQDLENEIEDYRRLRSGHLAVSHQDFMQDLAGSLIRQRIAVGLSREQLANLIHASVEDVSDLEDSGYEAASLEIVAAVAEAIRAPASFVSRLNASLSKSAFTTGFSSIGISMKILRNRLLPPELTDMLDRSRTQQSELASRAYFEVVNFVSGVLGMQPEDNPFDSRSRYKQLRISSPSFETSDNKNPDSVVSYALYAHRLAMIVEHTVRNIPYTRVPNDSTTIREEVVSSYGRLDLDTCLTYFWSHGVAVLPLGDEGSIHGAVWWINSRPIIMLKRRGNFPSRWLIDLLHELWHVLNTEDKKPISVVESNEISLTNSQSQEERAATQFALLVALQGRPVPLTQLVEQRANYSVEQLIHVLPRVAQEEQVGVGELADFMAYRLQSGPNHINWWPAATGLQPRGNPLRLARLQLLQRANLSVLSQIDRDLLLRALDEGPD